MKCKSLTGFSWESIDTDYVRAYEFLEEKYNNVYSTAAHQLAVLSGLSKGDIALDMGCGIGLSTEILAKIVGKNGKVLGFDISSMMLKRAREKLAVYPNVTFLQGDAYDVRDIVSRIGLRGSMDLVCSNFTYYYLNERRQYLHEQVFDILEENGHWAYNITSYLGRMELKGRAYNQFSSTFYEMLDSILKDKGYSDGIGSSVGKVPTLEEELRVLEIVGFSEIVAEAFPLPLTPSEAFYFTIDGFYQFGSKPTFSKTLCGMAQSDRIAVLHEAIELTKEEMDSTGENPTVINVCARR